jgi:hypothetical protein
VSQSYLYGQASLRASYVNERFVLAPGKFRGDDMSRAQVDSGHR